ncbi:MAG: tetratricopeptide repeat protein [Planctomycetes bacterium]|nr:tetratricopeptide repeat protein [Planctomycetota bacterium]
MPRIIALFLLLFVSSAFTQEVRPRNRELDALRETLGSGNQDDPEALKKSRLRWPEYEAVIAKAIEMQDSARAVGGEKLAQCIDSYALNASMRDTALDYYLAGRILGLAGRLDEARKHFEQALERDPYFFWAAHGLGTCFANKNMYEAAVRHYLRATELNPKFAMAARGLALCQARLGQHEAAEKVLRRVLQNDARDADSLSALASVLIDQARYGEAAAVLEEAKLVEAKLPDLDLRLALCYRRSDQAERAVSLYESIVRTRPEEWKAWLALAEIFQRQGRNHAAADAVEKALAHLPTAAAADRDRLAADAARLRSLPAVMIPDPREKSAEELIDLLLHSAEVERRRDAVRVLWRVEWRHKTLAQCMLHALKDKDEQVKALALKSIAREYPKENVPDLTRLLTLLLRDGSAYVRGLAADILGSGEHPSAVPVLMTALGEQDPYAFRLIHRALNHSTFGYVEILEPATMDEAARTRISDAWRAWYATEKDRYSRYEEPKK